MLNIAVALHETLDFVTLWRLCKTALTYTSDTECL